MVGRRSSPSPRSITPEVRFEGRERVVGDLGRGRGDRGEDRRLAGIGQPDETDVGDEPQLQADPRLGAGLALLGVLGGLVGGRLEVRVAEPAAAAARDHRRLADGDEVRQQLPGLVEVDRGPGRDVEGQVVAGPAVTSGAGPPAAGGGPEVMPVVEVAEGRLAGIDPQEDRAAAAAVAAIRSTAWDVRLLPEGRGPVATITGADPDLHAVEEHRGHSRTGELDPSRVRTASRVSRRREPRIPARDERTPAPPGAAPKCSARSSRAD